MISGRTSDTDDTAPVAKKTKKDVGHKFQNAWLKEFDWLVSGTNVLQGLQRISQSYQSKSNSALARHGSNMLIHETLDKHAKSKNHVT